MKQDDSRWAGVAPFPVLRLCKAAVVAAIAFLATLVAFGNVTDYGTNFAFVQHVLRMDTIFPGAGIHYRAIHSPLLHHAAYWLIIGCEALVALACWMGAWRMLLRLRASAASFARAKHAAYVGLTLGFLVWQVGFMSIGGEWFGMWMSQQWNGLDSAFRFFITMLAALVFVAMPDA